MISLSPRITPSPRAHDLGAALALLVAAGLGCTEKAGTLIGTQDEGESCAQISDCKAGFTCGDGKTCVALVRPDTTGRAGTSCTASSGCATGLCCGNQSVCRDHLRDFEADRCGMAPGDLCGFSADCDVGLVCDGTGHCAAPGGANQAARGDACEDFSDCKRPLICGATGTCEPPPFFAGVSCQRSEEELGAFRGYFEIPRNDLPLDEFYRQPFPSDVRRVGGGLDLRGHPSPGEVAGVDFTGLYLDAISADDDGFGLSEPVFMQFSDLIDRRTITATAADPTVMLVNIDPASPEQGERVPIQLSYVEDRGLFMCSNALAVAPIDGVALRPHTTYAVLVTSAIRTVRGEAPIHDTDFAMVLSAERPTNDADGARAWDAYAPLRAWLTSEQRAGDTLALAAVYTTGDPAAIAPKVREAVQAAPAPVVRELVRCRAGVTSPCAEAGTERGCLPDDPAFIQLQGKVSSPVLQKGTRPYPGPGPDGHEGAMILDAQGKIVLQGSEDICVGLTIPVGPMPADGWPVVIYGHGTGGDYLTGLRDLPGDLTNVRDAQGVMLARMAVLTFDGALHGPRQGLPVPLRGNPGRLFFNAANPRAARDNVLQGAADVHNLVRLVRSLELTAVQTGGAAAKFDPAHVLYYGHSQGTVVGAPFIAAEPDLRAAVFTGAGAEIGLTMIYKRKPNDVATLTRAAFGDQSVTRLHPMIGLMSLFFGPSDAVPYGRWIALEPPTGRHPLDFLHVYGTDDGYVPEVTQQALVRAGGYPIVGMVLRPIPGVDAVAGPATGNLNGASVGVVQYRPTRTGATLDYDGHFVGAHDPDAKAAIARFLGTAATRDTPATIGR